MPSTEGSTLNFQTRQHVEEYTWNIFCILADVIDAAFIKLDIPVMVQDDVPYGLGKHISESLLSVSLGGCNITKMKDTQTHTKVKKKNLLL